MIRYAMSLAVIAWTDQANAAAVAPRENGNPIFWLVILFAVMIGIGWKILSDNSNDDAALTGELPPLLSTVTPVTDGTFDVNIVRTIDRHPPIFSKNPLKWIDNSNNYNDHLKYITEIQAEANNRVKAGFAQFRSDQESLKDQQQALYVMAYQASQIAKETVARLPAVTGSLKDVSQPVHIPMPAEPNILTLSAAEKRDARMMKGNAHAGARIATTAVKGDLGSALAGLVIVGAINVITFQRKARQLHDSHGRVKIYAERARQDIQILGEVHEKIVEASHKIYDQSARLRPLLIWAQDQRLEGGALSRNQEAPEGEALSKLNLIASYAALARIQAGKPVS